MNIFGVNQPMWGKLSLCDGDKNSWWQTKIWSPVVSAFLPSLKTHCELCLGQQHDVDCLLQHSFVIYSCQNFYTNFGCFTFPISEANEFVTIEFWGVPSTHMLWDGSWAPRNGKATTTDFILTTLNEGIAPQKCKTWYYRRVYQENGRRNLHT